MDFLLPRINEFVKDAGVLCSLEVVGDKFPEHEQIMIVTQDAAQGFELLRTLTQAARAGRTEETQLEPEVFDAFAPFVKLFRRLAVTSYFTGFATTAINP